jgi:hypothetical protein
VGNLPHSLLYISCGRRFKHNVTFLPPFLLYLSFTTHLQEAHYTEAEFNAPINSLPPSLTHLVLSDSFNYPVDSLPPTLTHLTFGSDFNHPVTALPHSLLHLVFGKGFNQDVTHLPPQITHLTLGSQFTKFIDDIPKSVRQFTKMCPSRTGLRPPVIVNCRFPPIRVLIMETPFSFYGSGRKEELLRIFRLKELPCRIKWKKTDPSPNHDFSWDNNKIY